MEFAVPEIEDNTSGWGPLSVPKDFEDVPFAPFSKAEKIGRCADFTAQGRSYAAQRSYGRHRDENAAVETVFNFQGDDHETDFHLVDSRPVSRPTFARRRPQWRNRRFQEDDKDMTGAEREKQRRQYAKEKKKQHWGASYWNQLETRQRVTLQSSVEIRPDWSVVEQFDFSTLTKQQHEAGEGQTLKRCGVLKGYDITLDRLTPKFNRALRKTTSKFPVKVSTSDDPVIQTLARENAGHVFATDAILATLMCAPRSNYSWDVVAHRVGDKIFFDRRSPEFDKVTVSETAQGLPEEDRESINHLEKLKDEATLVNANFLAMALSDKEKSYKLGSSHPFKGKEGNSDTGFSYRKWTLEEGLDVVVRCELDSVIKRKKGQETVLMVRALNEYDSRVSGSDYRQKLENQRGAVVATELKNNANKLAKWTTQAILGEVDLIKLGFASRSHPRSAANHEVLSTQMYKPKDFASQINLNEKNMWGITKYLVDHIMKMPEGKYLIVKDPNKPILRLYDIPMDAFEASAYE
jgi:translation initiation factor 3 subunit D